MITVIAGTNRRNSEALVFARHYQRAFQQKTAGTVHLIALEDLPPEVYHSAMYEKDHQHQMIRTIQDEKLVPAEKFFFIVPEYNGSFPGALKFFIDAISVREYQKTFKGKKAAMAGIATGRAGNLRGLEHLTGILNHVGTIVYPNRLPISSIAALTTDDQRIADPRILKIIDNQIDEFLAF